MFSFQRQQGVSVEVFLKPPAGMLGFIETKVKCVLKQGILNLKSVLKLAV